ncbi:uncharacterized mitochondrial protein AtMg00810-like [Humulus lupulus]|uniref:uncharacterized mitochondrial protein AtMg00810-like n=1 Tax=Humulus lupulus TaxID=3486 RepID=UPI002B40EAC7|nr:uncharacterized mitochondrial protein AtMg00810-like [Humulus lupulus]
MTLCQLQSRYFIFHASASSVCDYVVIYVDDIVITGNDSEELQKFILKLNQVFSLKDLGPLNFFLGIEVCRDATGLYLSQSKYISKLLQRTIMMYVKPCPAPMVAGIPLSIHDGETLNTPTTYRSIIGALQYLSHTRPDISFAVNKLSQFLKSPTTKHWNAAKRILRYLKGTMYHGLHIAPSNRLVLTGFSDADWGCCPDDRKSIAGYCVFLGESLISWSSQKQSVVARSSTESEYRALAQLAAELSWLLELLKEMHIQIPTTPIIWCDNISASALAANPVYHARTKHIELDVHFVRDKVLQKQLDIRYIPSHDQIAGCLTKGLSPSRFQFLVDKLQVMESPCSLRGGVK